MFWDVTTGKQYAGPGADYKYATGTVTVGFNLMGIWPPYSDGHKTHTHIYIYIYIHTYAYLLLYYILFVFYSILNIQGTDINSVDISRDNSLVVTAVCIYE